MAYSGRGAAPTADEVWATLKPDVYNIVKQPERGLEPAKYMGIYTKVYDHCTAKSGAHHMGTAANVNGRDLYSLLKSLCQDFMDELHNEARSLVDIDLLGFYMKEWNKYTVAAKYLDHLFVYINRHWVKRKVDENDSSVYRVHTMVLMAWKEKLFNPMCSSLVKALLSQIERERQGETIDRSLLKTVIDSFVALDLPTDSTGSTASLSNLSEQTLMSPTSVYKVTFECKFFEQTQAFYTAESTAFLAENSVVEYMKKAEARLDEEVERVKMYLHESTLAALVTLCEDRLIFDHEQRLKEEFGTLLQNDKDEDMGRMYKLVARKPDRLQTLRTKLESHVQSVGKEAVDAVVAGAAAAASGAAAPGGGDDDGGDEGGADGTAAGAVAIDPKVYVDALLAVYNKYNTLVSGAFSSDVGFVQSLDRACGEFINRNKVCEKSPKRSPELLAKYCDVLLRKSSKNPEEAELERLLSSIMVVFKFIEDKDVFQGFYTRALSRRLIGQASASADAEEVMITKLREACGNEYTTKLQRMFTDVGVSKDINAAFQKSVTTHANPGELVDLQIMVLTTGSWPGSTAPTEFQLPLELEKTHRKFTEYYDANYQNRKLIWKHDQSRGELRAAFSTKVKVPYSFAVSVYQMGILLQYNHGDEFSFEELTVSTSLSKDFLAGNLNVLLKAKVLLLKGTAKVGEPASRYAINTAYANKKQRMNLNVRIKAEEKADAEETNKNIEEDRKHLIQAAIVRVMKTRKQLRHHGLVSEVIMQLASRFQPKIPDIKKQIDVLMEKEYLERVEGEKDLYNYMA
ncbi:cullin-1 [Blastocladiella britannica]|nr:cullin-1 [Blastocladiella britannica]